MVNQMARTKTAMKNSENEKIAEKITKDAKRGESGFKQPSQERSFPELKPEAAAAALWNSLAIGEQPMLSADQSINAAGLLGNQSVLGLIEKGARTQDALNSTRADIDVNMLAQALSGPPDGPVCNMESVLAG